MMSGDLESDLETLETLCFPISTVLQLISLRTVPPAYSSSYFEGFWKPCPALSLYLEPLETRT
jgi:hypothetical protein